MKSFCILRRKNFGKVSSMENYAAMTDLNLTQLSNDLLDLKKIIA